MPTSSEGPLRVTHRLLEVLVVVNVLYGLGILAMLVASVVNPDWLFPALGFRTAKEPMAQGLRMVAVGGLIGVPLAHLILRRLMAIVVTVRAGDPFVVENAERLKAIAWLVLWLQLLQVVIARIAIRIAELDLDLRFSITPWLAILLLFVLARVFEHGARLRADLEGTV